MKKIISVLLVAVMLFSMAACGAATEEKKEEKKESVTTYSFTYNKTKISAGQNMADVLKVIGEPKTYFEAESCAFKGLDKTYTYSGFEITTRPDGDKDFINSIRLTDDSVSTEEGLFIGSSKDDVIAKYGALDSSTKLSYEAGNVELCFILKDSKVISIEYMEVVK